MAFWFEAAHPYFFEHSDGANVVIETLGSDHLDPLRLKGPGDETMRHLGSIPLPLFYLDMGSIFNYDLSKHLDRKGPTR